MNNFYKAFLVASLLPLFSFGQSNYKPGYVVTLKGDTLHGFISYKEWNKNPQKIVFKNSLSENRKEEFTIKNASAFAVTGLEYYERKVVHVSTDQVDINKLSLAPDTSYVIDTVFLQMISKGRNVKLYSYVDDLKPRYYIMDNTDNSVRELEYHLYAKTDNSEVIKYLNKYRGQLEILAEKFGKNTPELNKRITDADYHQDELLKIVATINGEAEKQFTPKAIFGTRWFAGAAANYSSFRFNGSFLLARAPASNYLSPQIGAGFDMFPNKTIQKFYFRVELSFSYGQYHFSQSDPYATPAGTNAKLSVNQFNSIFAPQLIYNIYNKEKLKFFVGIGSALNLSSYSHHQVVTTYDLFPAKIQDQYPEFYNFWIAFPVKVGIAANKRFEVYVSYMPSTANAIDNTNDYYNFTVFHTSWAGGINYFFGVKS